MGFLSLNSPPNGAGRLLSAAIDAVISALNIPRRFLAAYFWIAGISCGRIHRGDAPVYLHPLGIVSSGDALENIPRSDRPGHLISALFRTGVKNKSRAAQEGRLPFRLFGWRGKEVWWPVLGLFLRLEAAG